MLSILCLLSSLLLQAVVQKAVAEHVNEPAARAAAVDTIMANSEGIFMYVSQACSGRRQLAVGCS
jgi:hypothetical protein